MEDINGNEQGLTLEELQGRAKNLQEQYRDIYPLEREIRVNLEQKLPEQTPLLNIPKSFLNPDTKFPTHFRPEDQIEIAVEKDLGKQELVWKIRNKTLSEEAKPLVPEGEIKEGTIEDMQKFIESVDPNKIGLHHLKPIIEEMKNNESKQKKLYLFIAQGKTAGIAFVKENSGGCYLERIATSPDFEKRGIGSALLTELKKRYESINVSPMPFDMTNADRADASEKLRRFYKQNGFVGATEWSRHTISLDDISTAGSWQIVDENTVWNIGIDQHKVSATDIKRGVLRFIAGNDPIIKRFPEEVRGKFYEWDANYKEMRRTEEQQEETNKALTSASSREYWKKQYSVKI